MKKWWIFAMASLVLSSYIFTMDQLKQKYSWPDRNPDLAFDNHSMFVNEAQVARLFNSLHALIVVELGSWVGASTRFIAQHVPHATIIAIDHWRGSAEHQIKHKDKLPALYELFLSNCWYLKDCLIPMRTTTQDGLDELHSLGIVPDIFYVDASHDYVSVSADLEKIHRYFPNAIITGDDWCWDKLIGDYFPVRRAVIDFAARYSFAIDYEGEFWRIRK